MSRHGRPRTAKPKEPARPDRAIAGSPPDFPSEDQRCNAYRAKGEEHAIGERNNLPELSPIPEPPRRLARADGGKAQHAFFFAFIIIENTHLRRDNRSPMSDEARAFDLTRNPAG